jgi:hypothetical protein
MEYAAYLRAEAKKYRALAEEAASELLARELARGDLRACGRRGREPPNRRVIVMRSKGRSRAPRSPAEFLRQTVESGLVDAAGGFVTLANFTCFYGIPG